MGYTTILKIAALIDIFFMILSLKSKTRRSCALAACGFFAAFVAVTYIRSATLTDYLPMSIMASLYFIGIDLLLVSLCAYVMYYTDQQTISGSHVADSLLKLYLAIDIMILLFNPFKEIAISYIYDERGMSHWRYSPKLLYDLHIIYSYILIALILLMLIRKTVNVPRIFRIKFLAIIYGILIIVAINGVFLLFQTSGFYDVSILLYTFVLAYIYLFDFHIIKRATKNRARELMLEKMSSPILLFDNEEKLLVYSNSVKDIIDQDIDQNLTMESFIRKVHLENEHFDFASERSVILYRTVNGARKVYRCDYKPLRDGAAKSIFGYLFVFTDSSLDVDPLTEFFSRTRFYKWTAVENDRIYLLPALVIAYDINEMSLINSQHGHDQGDQALRTLANAIRATMPPDSYFARLNDAILLSISPRVDSSHIDEYIDTIRDRVKKSSTLPFKFDFAYGSYQIGSSEEKITAAVDTAISALYLKKMMDNRSLHASLRNLLVQIQQECDSSTDGHIERIHNLCMRLGRRLGYSERQLSELALLCITLDIGKLGIPPEILNKPGKLTDQEWEILKSHTEKGYRIAKASKELSIIADCILHHHERWDGKGYPDGLKAEAIPLLSRVVAVIDAYDAMISDRPYRKKLLVSQALEEIRRNAGVQFDPTIATEFIKMIQEQTGIAPDGSSNEFIKPILTLRADEDSRELENENLHLLHFSRYVLDENDHILSADENFEMITGYSRSDIVEMKLCQLDLIPPEDRDRYTALAAMTVSSNGYAYIEHRLRRKDNTNINIFCLGRRFYDSAARKMRNAIFITDISQSKTIQRLVDKGLVSMKRSLTAYESLARKDSLTGILNNSAFANDAQEKLYEEEKVHILLMIDLDNFKSYNDAYGHPAGDELLKSFSIKLQETIGDVGIYGRMGGDEFAVLISEEKDTDLSVIEELISNVTNVLCDSAKSFSPTLSVSIGAKINESGSTSFSAIYRDADIALYEAKQNGKGHYILKN